MKLITALILLLSLPLLFASCGGDTHQSIAEEVRGEFSKVVDILESVKDEASAQAAVEKIAKIQKNIDDIGVRAKKLGTPDAETTQKMLKEVDVENSPVIKMVMEMERVGSLPGGAEVKKAVEALIS